MTDLLIILLEMHNINIMFVPPSDRGDYKKGKRLLDINKSSSLLASKRFYEVDYIFEDPVQQKHKKIQRQHSFQVPLDRTIESCQKELNKSQLIYKSMMKNMHQSFLVNREIPKKQPNFVSQKDRSQVIHSRKSPRCHFWKRNSLSSNSVRPQSKQKGIRNLIKLIDPQVKQLMMTPQGKRMSLTSKNERMFRLDFKNDLPITSRKSTRSQATPQTPKRRFWSKNYRPWSPQKRNLYVQDDLSATIDQFAQINL